MKLSIIIPVYNEAKTVAQLISAVKDVDVGKIGLEKEIIVVDDGSNDGTGKILEKTGGIKLIMQPANRGKGAAVRAGISRADGNILVVQDADLEYNPQQIPGIVKPIVEGRARVVYGSRFAGKISGRRIALHDLGNRFLSAATSLLYGARVTDMETCYKAFARDALKGIELKAEKFDIEPEITAKLLKKGERILEVPIEYRSRGFEEGKKINWKDGVQAFFTLLKYRFGD